MATFSQGFLSALTRPGYAQQLGMLGRQIGNAPAQARQQQMMQQEKERLSQIDLSTPEGMRAMAKVLQEKGEIGRAGQLVGMADKAEKEAALTKTTKEKEAKLRGQAFIKAAKSDDPSTWNALVQNMDADQLMDYLTPKKPSKATPAKPETVTLFDETSGQNQTYAIYRDEEGVVQKKLLGASERKEEGPQDSNLDTKWGSDLLGEARERGQEARAQADMLNTVATQAGERSWYQRGMVGSAVSNIEEQMGIAGAFSTHRYRINQLRMDNVLAMLPPGVASDKDVQLAMDSTIDPNNLSNEEAEAYLRGMAKIAEAEAEYYETKTRYIQATGDANAVGYEAWIDRKAAQNNVDALRAEYPKGMLQVSERLSQAVALQGPERDAALQNLNAVFPEVMKALGDLDQAETSWEAFKKGRTIRGFD